MRPEAFVYTSSPFFFFFSVNSRLKGNKKRFLNKFQSTQFQSVGQKPPITSHDEWHQKNEVSLLCLPLMEPLNWLAYGENN